MRAVLRILVLDASHGERFEQLVVLLLRCSAEEGGVLDAYFSHANEFPESPAVSLVPDVWDRLTAFFEAGVAARAWRSVEPALLLISLWSLCKAVADPNRRPRRGTPFPIDNLNRRILGVLRRRGEALSTPDVVDAIAAEMGYGDDALSHVQARVRDGLKKLAKDARGSVRKQGERRDARWTLNGGQTTLGATVCLLTAGCNA